MADYQWNFRANSGGLTTANSGLNSLIGNLASGQKATTALTSAFNTSTAALGPWGAALQIGIQGLRLMTDEAKKLYQEIIKVFVPFQQVSAEIEVLGRASDPTGEHVKGLMGEIKRLGAETAFSASQVAEAARAMLRAGQTAEEATGNLETALSAALATGVSVEKAFGTGNTALLKFGDNLGFVSENGDKLQSALALITAAANASPTDFNAMSRAIRGNTGALQQMNISLLDSVTALAILAKAGVEGNKAVRLLNSNLQNLASNNRAKAALDELGVSIGNDAGEFKNLAEIAGDLSSALDMKSPIEQASILANLFGKNAQAMSALLGSGEEGFAKMRETILSNTNVLTELRTAQEAALGGVLKRVDSVREAITLAWGTLLNPAITEFWREIANMLGGFQKRLEAIAINVNEEFQRLKESGVGTIDAWIQAMSTSADWGKLWEDFSSYVSPVTDMLVKLWYAAIDQMREFAQETLGNVELWQDIGKIMLSGIWTAFKQLPRLMQGLFVGAMKAAVNNMVAVIPEPLRKALGISGESGASPEASLGGGDLGNDPFTTEDIDLDRPKTEREKAIDLVLQAQDAYEENQEKREKPIRDAILARAGELQSGGMGFEGALSQANQESATKQKADAQKAILESQVKILDTEMQLAQARDAVVKKTDEMVIAQSELEISLESMGSKFKTWLLEPWDKFKQATYAVKEQFAGIGGVFEKLAQKKNDLFGRLGLKQTDNQSILMESYQQSQQNLQLAQSPAERAAALEALAGRATDLYEGGGSTSKTLQQDAQKYIEQAMAERKKQQEVELKKIALEKEQNEFTIKELEGLKGKVKSPEKQIEVLSQLMEAFQQTGDVLGAQAILPELQQAKRDAAGRQTEIIQQQLKADEIRNTLLESLLEAVKLQGDDVKKQAEKEPVILDPAMAMA